MLEFHGWPPWRGGFDNRFGRCEHCFKSQADPIIVVRGLLIAGYFHSSTFNNEKNTKNKNSCREILKVCNLQDMLVGMSKEAWFSYLSKVLVFSSFSDACLDDEK